MPSSADRVAPIPVESPAAGSAERTDGGLDARTGGWAAAIVNYGSYAHARRCVESLREQTLRPDEIVLVDVVDADDGARGGDRATAADGLGVRWESMPNRGFAGGANRGVEILRRTTQARFLLLLNPDVRLAPSFAERLVGAMDERPRVAVATGKLLRPDGTIDSAGITLPRHRRPRDRGSEEIDRGQYDETELVFAASGAAMMVRAGAIGALSLDGELFDEDFFLYHEDTDLCWRARRLGWQVLYVPAARALHERAWRRDRRFEIDPRVRRHSFKNHYLQIIKNETQRDFWLNLPVLAAWEVLRLGFAVARDREMLSAYADAWRFAGRAWRKRRLVAAATRGAARPPVAVAPLRDEAPR